MPFERDPLYLKWMEFKRLNNKIHRVVTGKFYKINFGCLFNCLVFFSKVLRIKEQGFKVNSNI